MPGNTLRCYLCSIMLKSIHTFKWSCYGSKCSNVINKLLMNRKKQHQLVGAWNFQIQFSVRFRSDQLKKKINKRKSELKGKKHKNIIYLTIQKSILKMSAITKGFNFARHPYSLMLRKTYNHKNFISKVASRSISSINGSNYFMVCIFAVIKPSCNEIIITKRRDKLWLNESRRNWEEALDSSDTKV